MGGLSKGEVASASLTNAFRKWFREIFPEMLLKGVGQGALIQSWGGLINEMNVRITNYGLDNKVRLGTTVVALLIAGGKYHIINVGDSRAYLITDTISQLTKDQTFIQREMDAGNMTYEEAMSSPQRNVLLQCVGSSDMIAPDFFFGDVPPGAAFLLCSDGFRHCVTNDEIYERLGPEAAADEEAIENAMRYLVELDKTRMETDNISACVVKVSG
jgi:serine/threonine protein phosphatase PrpC